MVRDLWKPTFPKWCRTVTDQVRFAPDRKAIAQELTAHYEDHLQALLDLGYEQDEAEARALESMGDAEAVGRALNHVHKFWLGVLWKFSQILLLVLMLFLPISLLWEHHDLGCLPLIDRTVAEWNYEAPPHWASQQDIPGGTVYLAPSEDVTWTEEGKPIYHATFWVELDRPTNQLLWSNHLEFTDQNGPIFSSRQNRDLGAQEPYYGYLALSEGTEGWTRHQYDIHLILDHSPEFLEVAQPFGEKPWSIRCSWEVTP